MSAANPTQLLGSNAAHVVRLPNASVAGQSISATLAGQPMSTSLAMPKTLGVADSTVKPKLKMSVTQVAAMAKSTSAITSPKTLTQIPIQLGGQVKNQHITLAALNQLTAGKLSAGKLTGTQVNTSIGKTVQIISPTKSGIKQVQTSPKPGMNNPILSPQQQVVSTSVLSQQTLKVASTGATTTAASSASTQYALVRAQLPGTGGAPPQTVTFIRAIGPNTSSTSGGTTVTVTPQQMAALLKGQQGQSQIQKVISAATGGSQLRAPAPMNAAGALKVGTSPANSSKLVSVQFPPRMAATNPLKNVNVSSLLGSKVGTVTTQATNISPMATLVSGSGTKTPSPISLVNQFPAVRPQLPSALTNIGLSMLSNKSQTASTLVTTMQASNSVTALLAANSAVTSTNVSTTAQPTTSVTSVVGAASPVMDAILSAEAAEEVKPDTSANIAPVSAEEYAESTTESLSNGIKGIKPNDLCDNAAEDCNIESEVKEEGKLLGESKMEVDEPDKIAADEKPVTSQEELDEKPDISMNVEKNEENAVSVEAEIKLEPHDTSSVESAAATTLAQLATIANIPNIPSRSLSTTLPDISNNPLSTLAALASSSPIATGPLGRAPLVNGKNTSTKPIAAILPMTGKRVSVTVTF